MGVQDSSLKAILSGVVPPERRSTAFGAFDTSFGIAWFAGSALMGLIYGKSILALVLFSMVLSLPRCRFYPLQTKRNHWNSPGLFDSHSTSLGLHLAAKIPSQPAGRCSGGWVWFVLGVYAAFAACATLPAIAGSVTLAFPVST